MVNHQLLGWLNWGIDIDLPLASMIMGYPSVRVVPETSSALLMVASIDDYGIVSITVSHSNVLLLICNHNNGANTMSHDYQ